MGSLEDADPELLKTFEKLGVSLNEQKLLANVAVDAVFDSVSIGTKFKKQLQKAGVIFCSITEAVEKYPHLVEKYLAGVVPIGDNYFSALFRYFFYFVYYLFNDSYFLRFFHIESRPRILPIFS